MKITDEAVQAACSVFYGWFNLPTTTQSEKSTAKAEMLYALTAAYPHLALSSAPCSVEVADMAVVSRLAARADGYDEEDRNGYWPDIQDVMVSLGEIRVLRRILSQIVTKPVDVAAVRRQALEDAANLVETSAYRSTTEGRSIVPSQFAKHDRHHATIAAAIRALSPAEPAPTIDLDAIVNAIKPFAQLAPPPLIPDYIWSLPDEAVMHVTATPETYIKAKHFRAIAALYAALTAPTRTTEAGE